jgi:hypothetical protein
MIDFMITMVLVALGILLGVDAFQKWRPTRVVWYILAAIGGLLAALAAFADWADAIYMLILVLVLRVVAGAVTKRKA